MTSIFWFTSDLRIADHPALVAQAQGDRLLCIYCQRSPVPWCNVSGTGLQRSRFQSESLAALREQLQTLGQDLLLLNGDPLLEIPKLVQAFNVSSLGTTQSNGSYEQQQLQQLRSLLDIPVHIHRRRTLLSAEQVAPLPKQFTPFRKVVEDIAPIPCTAAPSVLPPPPPGVAFRPVVAPSTRAHPSFTARGGSENGQRRLQQWMFERRAIDHYKETRNALSGLDHSSQLSPWLANGCLSVNQVAAAVGEYERQFESNPSTRWLYLELLWREYFHWRARQDGLRLFAASGIARKRQLKTFEPRAFARWCQGDTDYPLVNALMRQLVASGWMSNRGRQIAASCLINELQHDWRYGAAFFQKHLIDHDVASNYGNWQYIAGVGCDPRGGRHFNLDKQTRDFDPEGLFINSWGGQRPVQPEFVTDAADWPIEPD